METIRDTGYRDELARLTPGLRRFARALVRNHLVDVADDLVQSTLTRALQSEQGRRGLRLQIKLFSILVGLHRDHVRDLGAERTSASPVSELPREADAAWRSTRREPAVLSSIPVEYREALLLVVLEGLTYAQVAECLGLSAATVATRVARARDYLARAQTGWSSAKPVNVAEPRTARAGASHLRLVK